jgi:hypothetical protein
VEALTLGLACRLLRTSTLEKRLLGLTLIREAIARCTTTTGATQSAVRREGKHFNKKGGVTCDM